MIIVDRIEEAKAVCDNDGTMIDIPLEQVSPGVKSGDVLVDCGDGSFFTVDELETAQRRDNIQQRFKRIYEGQK